MLVINLLIWNKKNQQYQAGYYKGIAKKKKQ